MKLGGSAISRPARLRTAIATATAASAAAYRVTGRSAAIAKRCAQRPIILSTCPQPRVPCDTEPPIGANVKRGLEVPSPEAVLLARRHADGAVQADVFAVEIA